MEVEMMVSSKEGDEEKGEDVPLPGFRFHPTDEELVGFYLRRKVEKRPISIELIKHVDIYKYDPWDLPKGSNVGDNEWYFFCKRGRKYRNSIRPNRVTTSGFWKATGIDRSIYSAGGCDCIGLKKSLVYYRGSAGKGTKTDWMMHEFRLPMPAHDDDKKNNDNLLPLEAEVWTLCRIFKRKALYKKCLPDWRETSATKRNHVKTVSSNPCSGMESNNHLGYISFISSAPVKTQQSQNRHLPAYSHPSQHHLDHHGANQTIVSQLMSSISNQAPSDASHTSFCSPEMNEIVKYGDWDELRSVEEYFGTVDPFVM